tara:strand:+ start:193 stop:585 length:393 start_codon:yes stop_codon:yes gene_type:complete
MIFHISFCKTNTFGDKQIIIMLNQYFEKSNNIQLLGHHFFIDKDDSVFQIEIEIETDNFNIAMIDAFRVINKLSNIAKTNFTQSIVILHFTTNNLPIIAKSQLDCSKDFFIYETHNETLWRKNCLSIQKN